MSCPTNPPMIPAGATIFHDVELIFKPPTKGMQILIEWSGKTFGPYLNWDEAKQHGFKEPKD